jgi:hypothetical protein
LAGFITVQRASVTRCPASGDAPFLTGRFRHSISGRIIFAGAARSARVGVAALLRAIPGKLASKVAPGVSDGEQTAGSAEFDFHENHASHAAITHLRISKLIAESEGNERNVSTEQGTAIKFSFSFLFETVRPRGPAFAAGGPGRSSNSNRIKKSSAAIARPRCWRLD